MSSFHFFGTSRFKCQDDGIFEEYFSTSKNNAYSPSNSTSSNSLPPLNLGSSSGNSIGYQLPFDDPFAAGSGQKPYIGNDGAFGEEVMYQDEVFNFDPEGNLIDIPSPARRTQNHLGSDSAASARVRGEHEAGHVLPSHDVEGDFNMYNYGEDDVPLPDAEPFPEGGVFMTGGLGGNDQPLPIIGNDRIHSSPFQSSEPSTITADAPLAKTKKPKSKKALEIDPVIELRNSALAAFRDEYIENMAAASLVKKNHKAATAAKKNAFHFVYGTGLLGVGDGLGSLKFSHPLNIFAGDYLFSKITGKPIPSTPSKRSKRALAVDNEEEQQTPKRPRQAEDEIGRGFNDEDIPMNFEDEFNHEHSVELGRNAPSALQDYPSSALMPWNISASLRGSKTGSLARRLTSASPLIGRGSVMLGEIDGFSLMQEGDEVMYGRDDDFGSPPGGFSNGNAASSSHAHGFESQGAASEFEVFGAAANVDTQTAGTSQWVRQALDKESNNFFEYVRNTIDEKTVAGEDVEMEGEEKGGFVTFEELFSVDANSCVVAAQAFYHVLCLATKRRVWVQQDGVENGEIGGDIRIGVVEVV
jgi:hypothetical protein